MDNCLDGAIVVMLLGIMAQTFGLYVGMAITLIAVFVVRNALRGER